MKSKATKSRRKNRPKLFIREEDMTLEQLAEKEKETLRKEKHKNLRIWLDKLENMQTILRTEEGMELALLNQNDKFEADFKSL